MMQALLSLYKRIFSLLLHAAAGSLGACRFQPTCSEYAVVAISAQGIFRGSWLTLARILRCNPLCAGGFDPVPGTYPAVSPSIVSRDNRGRAFLHTSAPPVTIDISASNPASISALQPQLHDHR